MCLRARFKTSLACITHCPYVMLCDLITCYSIDSAWFQRLELEHYKLVSILALNFKLRRYAPAAAGADNDPADGRDPPCLQSDSRALAEQSFGASGVTAQTRGPE